MPKKLLALNAGLVVVAAVCILYIVRQVMAPMPLPGAGRPRPAAQTAASAQADTPRLPAGAYGVVASRNLFSPTRSEAPPSAVAAGAPPLVKPNLFGVVLREGSPIAYLEDPTTKRVAGYRVGDSIVGGTVQSIAADSVVISRPDGKVDVRLRDPSRPRPAAPPAGALAPGTPGAPPVPGTTLPGVIPPAAHSDRPVAGEPASPESRSVLPPGFVPGRRPLPPNLLRRMPQPPPSDARQQ